MAEPQVQSKRLFHLEAWPRSEIERPPRLSQQVTDRFSDVLIFCFAQEQRHALHHGLLRAILGLRGGQGTTLGSAEVLHGGCSHWLCHAKRGRGHGHWKNLRGRDVPWKCHLTSIKEHKTKNEDSQRIPKSQRAQKRIKLSP